MKYMKFHNLFDTENKKLNMPCPNYELARMCLTSLETRQLNKIIFAMRSRPKVFKAMQNLVPGLGHLHDVQAVKCPWPIEKL